MGDQKRTSQTDNGVFFKNLDFPIRRKKLSYGIGLCDIFRAAFFDLAFSITTSYRNGIHFQSENIVIEKNRVTRYQGVCIH